MRYKDYPGFTKTYVIVHNTGFGTPEDIYEEIASVAEAENLSEAVALSKKLTAENNPDKDLESSWCFNTYHINVNTLTEKGKELLAELNVHIDTLFEKVKNNPNDYNTVKNGGITYRLQKMPEFDEPANISSFSLLIPKEELR